MSEPSVHPVELFRARLEALKDYPSGVAPVWRYIEGTAFFSAGAGLDLSKTAPELPPFPFRGVMLVGHNLDSVAQYQKRLDSGIPHGDLRRPMTTWRNLRRLLRDAGISTTECFFTNAFVGLNEVSTTGTFPGAKDPQFRRWCADFLTEQVMIMAPRLLVALGAPAQRFLSTLIRPEPPEWGRRSLAPSALVAGSIASHDFECLSIVHPSSHHTPFGQRRRVLDLEALRRTGAGQ